jgi:hypothetical protein
MDARALGPLPALLAGCSWAIVRGVPDDAPDARALDDDPPCADTFAWPIADAAMVSVLGPFALGFGVELADCDGPGCVATYAPLAAEAALGAAAFLLSAWEGIDTVKGCHAWIYRVRHTAPEARER